MDEVGEKVEGSGDYPEITIQEFLDFLKTAYQVHENLESILSCNGKTEAIDWLKLKENKLVKAKDAQQDSEVVADGSKDLISKKSSSVLSEKESIKKKLGEVLSEGLLDTVLPYLIPISAPNPSRRSSIAKGITEKPSQCNVSVIKRKSSDSCKTPNPKSDSEVEIHVCDEVKNLKQNFTCNQKLLVEKMGYFAEVTAGQKLEDMDISVHCDIGIFEWLMKWVKKDSLLEEDWPQLDSNCVIPILVSAAFLQMEPLQNDCLLFCHEHMNDILRTPTNLSCLNDSILTRLAAMYTNLEVELIKDRKDKIQSKIYTKLIQSLVEPEPESVRGHWCSLAWIYKCCKCQQLLSDVVSQRVPCVAQCMQLEYNGTILSKHIRDPTWNINDYIVGLYKALKTWRKVYWRLWGDAHFLYCVTCKKYFPAHQVNWCRYHPDCPQYFTLDAQKAPLPVGRYPCCGERAYRFQLLPDYSGCQFREHVIHPKDVKDSAILSLLQNYRNLIESEPPQLLFPERLTRLVAKEEGSSDTKKLCCNESFWWDGFQIVPPRPKLGLLSGFATRRHVEEEVVGGSSDEYSDDVSSTSTSSTSQSVSGASGESDPVQQMPIRKIIKRKKTKKDCLWQHNMSARSNQDIQRNYEENAIKEITCMLNRKFINISEGTLRHNKSFSRNITPIGGTWLRLESEWRETHCPSTTNQKTRSIFTGKLRPKLHKM